MSPSRRQLDEVADRLRALPGVDDAAVVARERLRRLHGGGTAAGDPPAAAELPATEPSRAGSAQVQPPALADDTPPAEVFGGDLPDREHAPQSLQEALRLAAEDPDRGTLYLSEDGSPNGGHFQSYRDLLTEAQRVLAGLRDSGVRPGESVLFQFADNRNFVTGFWACVLGGYLPTPVGVAPRHDRDNAVTRKLHNAWQLLEQPLVLTDRESLERVGRLAGLWSAPALRVAALEDLESGGEDTSWYPAGPDDPALHLLTSGSTGVPKCVRHHHRSILDRSLATALANGFGPDEVSLNWMPLDHVGGIVMYNVRDVLLRCHHVNAPTSAFLADPLRWLDWAQQVGATNTWAPNFAFALVNERAEELERRHWDLSRLRHVCNAGEAVVPRTAHRFLRLLHRHGLPADAMRPCWGMSETSSGITYSTLSAADQGVGTVRVSKDSLDGRPLVPAAADDPDGVLFTEVGPPVPGVGLRVVGTDNQVIPQRRIGRLQVRGATLMAGYHRNPEANREAFTADGWFNTGDLAFLDEGRLTITGREKDVVIIRGANYLTYDIESLVEQVPGVRTTFSAAAGYMPPGAQAEELAVFFVPASTDPAEHHGTISAVRTLLSRELGLHADLVIPLREDQFPKTESGKIQRGQLLKDLGAGRFAGQLAAAEAPELSSGTVPLFERVWQPSSPRRDEDQEREHPHGARGGVWVLLGEGTGPAAEAVRAAATAAGAEVVPVAVATEHGTTPIAALGGDRPVTAVLHTRCAAPSTAAADPRLALRDGPLSVLTVLRNLAARPVPLLVLTTGAVWARPGDRMVPVRTTLPGLLRTAVAERTVPLARQVDLPVDDQSRWPDVITAELAERAGDPVVAHRGGQRLLPRLRSVDPDTGTAETFRPGGTYLLTGGLGGIGRLVAEYLLAAYGARLLLLGRSDPAGDETARMLAELDELGEVTYRRVDVTDPAALRATIEEAERKWSEPLSGVLHLAGAHLDEYWHELESHTLRVERSEEFERMYLAKLFGTLAIADVLEDRPRTSLVLFSSVNAEFGGPSFGAYSSANGFLNGFADHWAQERHRPVRALSWSMWPGIGMNHATASSAAESRGFLPLTEETGVAALGEALRLGRPNLLVGLDPANPHIIGELATDQRDTAEIVLAYTADDDLDPELLRRTVEAVLPGSSVPLRFLRLPQLPHDEAALLTMLRSSRGHVRQYAEPVGELERTLAAIWSDVLGQARVGRDESFFEIGGNSVYAARLVSRISEKLAVRLPLHQLYEHPTVGALANTLSGSGRTTTSPNN